LRQQPIADERSDDADQKIADEPEIPFLERSGFGTDAFMAGPPGPARCFGARAMKDK
jgi:hypothetical protein